jgi:MYXO-CTERM domain-containing protein
LRGALWLSLLLGCGGAQPPQRSTPTDIGASEELRAQERQEARGVAAAALAEMAEADLTTEEGREVLSFSAASVMAVSTFLMMLGGMAEAESDCFAIERSESGGTTRTEVRADGCAGNAQDQKRSSGLLVLEERETECGKWASLTLSPWSIRDERACGSTGSPKGTRIYEGRIVSDECQDTVDIDLVLGGDGLDEIDGECRPVRQTALRYLLQSGDAATDNAPINGRGEVGLGGVGRATVETVDETMMSADCRSEAASGLTRARAGGHVAEVRYDGASECSDPGSAPLFLDGQPAGTTEHACAAGGSGPAPLAPLLLLLLVLRRRRVDG